LCRGNLIREAQSLSREEALSMRLTIELMPHEEVVLLKMFNIIQRAMQETGLR
jgi:hypothetical protein